MTLYRKVGSDWVQWMGEPIEDISHPPDIETKWSAADLNAIGLYFLLDAEPIPDGFTRANSDTPIGDVDGHPKIVYDLQTIPLDEYRQRAVERVAAFATEIEKRIDGHRSPGERVSYAAKEEAARKYIAGTDEPHDTTLLSAEASVTGEAVSDLASTIISKANAFREAVGLIAGMRRTITQSIEAAQSVSDVEAVLSDGIVQAEQTFAAWQTQHTP